MEKKKRVRPTVAQVKELEANIGKLEIKRKLLERSNRHLEEELKRVKQLDGDRTKKIRELSDELEFLKNRSFLERVFNVTS